MGIVLQVTVSMKAYLQSRKETTRRPGATPPRGAAVKPDTTRVKFSMQLYGLVVFTG
jgi:hypothetical protein